jgi:preprotein translocase subunit SecG
MLYYLLATLYVVACLLLLLVVLLQQGKGGDMASAFGGGGSQTAFGARAGATVLTRATTVLGVLFMLGAIVIGILGRQGPGSIMSGVAGPAPQTTTAPAPAVPASTPAASAPAPAATAPATPNTTPPAPPKIGGEAPAPEKK